MKEIINKLLEKWMCKHDWDLFKHIQVYDDFSGDMASGHIYIFICKKCGKIKKVKN